MSKLWGPPKSSPPHVQAGCRAIPSTASDRGVKHAERADCRPSSTQLRCDSHLGTKTTHAPREGGGRERGGSHLRAHATRRNQATTDGMTTTRARLALAEEWAQMTHLELRLSRSQPGTPGTRAPPPALTLRHATQTHDRTTTRRCERSAPQQPFPSRACRAPSCSTTRAASR